MKYRIEQDTDIENPRTSWDHACTMVCWHRRSDLGDETITDADQFLRELADDAVGFKCHYDDVPQKHIQAVLKKYYYINPLYLYEHSGMTMSLGPFSCPWDSGQVGFIYISKKDAAKYAGPGTDVDKVIDNLMEQEVKEYDQYLRGDVWCVAVVDNDDNHLDSCCGFFGHEYAEEEGKRMLEYCEQHAFDPAI